MLVNVALSLRAGFFSCEYLSPGNESTHANGPILWVGSSSLSTRFSIRASGHPTTLHALAGVVLSGQVWTAASSQSFMAKDSIPSWKCRCWHLNLF
ncbi:hypothetical protein CBR_g23944 [Chara braunii]|uniref:Uncharacterized protein n=1 Tax=Chara braunii TaxID=69332 RepID=A0A388L598_CHABU|nr:hypothetical protein CBR_g23944 [Chara braunii]|eukprot:GBG77499.1 hypothetical protein CBR_g23944 [Chara braunii]